MGVRYLDDGNPDGTGLGQTAVSKIGFWGATPVVQPATVADASNTATSAATTVNAVIARLESAGILASS